MILTACILLLLAGCNVEMNQNYELAETGQECNLLSDCSDSDMACFQNTCFTEEKLVSSFEPWVVSSMCKGACENCAQGKLKSTVVYGRNDKEYRVCTECATDRDCKEGLTCKIGRCSSA